MIKRDVTKINTGDKKQRDAVSDVMGFINGDYHKEGIILVLYGLRRTGKTTIMEQTMEACRRQKKCAFYEVEDTDTLTDVKKIIIGEKQQGTEVICLDEITKANDFISNSAVLPDIFAKEGMRIIVTGTDSLGFQFAENSELYDRTIRINTTHIPFAEHCRVLGTDDMDDYIQYGGLMRKGTDRKQIVYDYISACRYLDSAVAENISRSIKRNPEDNSLMELTLPELRTIIEKLVELYSGSFAIRNMQEELKKASVNYPVKKLAGMVDDSIIDRLTLESTDITKDFAKAINADTTIHHIITEDMVQTLEEYLIQMNLLSATTQNRFYYADGTGWQESRPVHEYYIIQPAIKYHHLQKAKEFIEQEDYYRELSGNEKRYMQQKLDEKIKGDMTEQIIVFDVSRDLPFSRYAVSKPVFYVNGQKKGEYDMLICDKETGRYWGFEIKHSTNPYYQQEKHLQNPAFREIMDYKYGNRENVCVLYRGEPFVSDSGTMYLNITDFMQKINKYRDMNMVFGELTRDLSTEEHECTEGQETEEDISI